MLPLLAATVMAIQRPDSLPPIPSSRQMAWHGMERTIFCHFGPNTFTGQEWGSGKEPTAVFNPRKLDCRQWCRAFKAAGFKGVIITAKHHDGFCLWPSKLSTHTVAQSPWKQGKGDVLLELSRACRESGLKFGVYLSPWDRNHPAYGTPEYNDVFKAMLREVLTHYGPVFEVWFDGANGEGPNGKRQVYDWPAFVRVVRECQPNACIFSDAGPDVRWVGNEDGYAGETNWNMIDRSKFEPGRADQKVLNTGLENGPDWVPAECDVSIRPGWFWRASEDSKVKSVEKLLDIWYGSVGRGANLLLNVPPNSDGLISDVDVRRLREFDGALKGEFAHEVTPSSVSPAYLTGRESIGEVKGHPLSNLIDGKDSTYWTQDGIEGIILQFDFSHPVSISRVALREPLTVGQSIASFQVLRDRRVCASGTTVGNRRIVRFQASPTRQLSIRITGFRGRPALSDVRFYE